MFIQWVQNLNISTLRLSI